MSAPLLPSPLDFIGYRHFAFLPPIKDAGPNEWILSRRSPFEIQVVNAGTGERYWIPKQYIGAVGEGEPVLVVGLTKELAFRAGCLEPRFKRVLQMPRIKPAVDDRENKIPRPPGLAPVVGIRIEEREGSSMNKALLTFGISAVVVAILAEILSLFGRS